MLFKKLVNQALVCDYQSDSNNLYEKTVRALLHNKLLMPFSLSFVSLLFTAKEFRSQDKNTKSSGRGKIFLVAVEVSDQSDAKL